jgi:hypothetical protein
MRKANKIVIWISIFFLLWWLLLLAAPYIDKYISDYEAAKSNFWSNLNFSEITENIKTITHNEKKTDELYLVAWWDIMLSRNIWHFAKKEWYDRVFKQWNFHPIFPFHNCIKDDCILFFNLESLFNEKDNDIPRGWFNFRANTGNIQTLLQLRQDHILTLSLANNHTVNTTYSWVVTTRNLLSENNIYYAWAGTNTWESREFIQINKNNIKLCIWAYSYEWQYIKVGAGKIAWNPYNERDMNEDLQKMIDTWCDVKIFSIHRWAEYRISPNNAQVQMAHNLIDAWADLILWWHAHVPGDIEVYSWKYIFYSFGNFIFDQWRWRRTPWWNYDHIFDYSLNKKTVPTYIWLLAWLKISKWKTWIVITLDDIKMNTITDGLLQPLDSETYLGIWNRINTSNIEIPTM